MVHQGLQETKSCVDLNDVIDCCMGYNVITHIAVLIAVRLTPHTTTHQSLNFIAFVNADADANCNAKMLMLLAHEL